MFYDTATLDEIDRISTLRFEPTDSSIKGSTHVAWINDTQAVAAMGDGLWQTDLQRLDKAERLGDHGVKLPHAMKKTASGRYLVYGGMDHPGRGEACEVGIFDLHTRTARRVELPATCWHVVCHPYGGSLLRPVLRVRPQDGLDWHEWGIAQFKEYAFEIDAETGQVLRHWSAGQDTPGTHQLGRVHLRPRADLLQRRQRHHHDDRPGELLVVPDSRRAAESDEHSCTPAGRPPVPSLDTLTRGSIVTNGHTSPSCAAGFTRHAGRFGLRLPALGGPVAAVHRQPRIEHDHGVQLSG